MIKTYSNSGLTATFTINIMPRMGKKVLWRVLEEGLYGIYACIPGTHPLWQMWKKQKKHIKQKWNNQLTLQQAYLSNTLEEGYSQEKEFRGFRKIKTDQTNSLKNCNTNRSLAVIEFQHRIHAKSCIVHERDHWHCKLQSWIIISCFVA